MHSQYLSALALALPVVAGYTSTLGCYSKVSSLTNQAGFQFMDYGWCTDKCSEGGYRIAALSGGKSCACSDKLPAESAKVDDDKCNIDCQGWPEDKCEPSPNRGVTARASFNGIFYNSG
jgi:cell wall integrity and stress response component